MTNPAVPDRFRFAAQPDSQYWFDARALGGSSRADAVVAANPGLARSVYEYALAEGLSIGSDLAVVCVMEMRWTEHARPGCTAVDFLSPGLGRQGVAMLMEAVDGKIGPETVRVGEIPIVVRESCGAPAGMRSAARRDLAEVAG